MPIELHPNCRARIVAVLEQELAKVHVSNSMFIVSPTIQGVQQADAALPTTEQIRAQLAAYIGEEPISDFVSETLSRELRSNNRYTPDGPVPLNSFAPYADIPQVARRLVDEFCSLPWTYSFLFELPESLQTLAFVIPAEHRVVSDQLAIYVPDENSDAIYPLTCGDPQRDSVMRGNSLLAMALGVAPNRVEMWDRTKTYLQVKVNGFLGEYATTSAAHEAVAIVKAFCGLGIALRLFKLNPKWRPTETRIKSITHRSVGGTWELHKGIELDTNVSHAYQDLVFEDFDGLISTGPAKVARLSQVLRGMRVALSSTTYSKRLLLAAQWLFDSVAAKDELLAFVQAAVTIEILLGDKAASDQVGLGELLRNRCAYLISTSQAQREEVMKDFRDIYDVRSKIVHTGKQKLNRHERGLLQKLRWMCARVVQREIEMLEADAARAQ